MGRYRTTVAVLLAVFLALQLLVHSNTVEAKKQSSKKNGKKASKVRKHPPPAKRNSGNGKSSICIQTGYVYYHTYCYSCINDLKCPSSSSVACQDNVGCTQCSSNYCLKPAANDVAASCFPAPVGCTTTGCKWNTGSTTPYCTKCISGYGLSGTSCVSCSSNCASGCTDGISGCTACTSSSFFVSGTPGVCKSCGGYDPYYPVESKWGYYCATCSTSTCLSCASNNNVAYLDTSTKKCERCRGYKYTAYCQQCNATTCLTCDSGYSVNSTGACVAAT